MNYYKLYRIFYKKTCRIVLNVDLTIYNFSTLDMTPNPDKKKSFIKCCLPEFYRCSYTLTEMSSTLVLPKGICNYFLFLHNSERFDYVHIIHFLIEKKSIKTSKCKHWPLKVAIPRQIPDRI